MRSQVVALAIVLALAPLIVRAAPPPKLSPEAYGRLPDIELMQLSPSGERLAYVTILGDHRNLQVKTLAGAVLFEAPLGDSKIRNLNWAGEDRLILTASKTNAVYLVPQEIDQSIVVNIATKKSFPVFAINDAVLHATYGYYGAVNRDGHWIGYFGGVTLSKTRGFEATLNNQSFVELYRVDLDTGASAIAAAGQQNPHEWALDASGSVVASAQYVQTTGEWSLRAGDGGRLLATLNHPFGEITLVGPGRTQGTVMVDKAVPEEWSLVDGSHQPLDVEGLVGGYLVDPTTRRLFGVWSAGDDPRQVFFEPTLKARQAALTRALDGAPILSSWSTDFRRLVLYTQGNGDAGTYWLVNGKEVKPYGYAYPELPDVNVGPTRVVVYKAADGLEIHGILTLPPGREPKGLPLVVLPHGGPQAHDTVAFDWMAQAFAGRGYAVFQPNFRGSDGYGLDFRDAGFGQWGRKMQTDISDGVAELVRQGVVDPKHACIVGASYGGYAALAGVTVQHGLYRCAVSYAGLSDLNYLLNEETASSDLPTAASRYLFKFLGVRANADASLHEISPARLADKADAPILLIHGTDDTVVPIGQSREMERALQKAGKPVEFVQLKGEDHWLSRDATRKAMLAAAVAFVEKHNPAD